eukprot:352209-Chlamydomonas_euryale.AAC.4
MSAFSVHAASCLYTTRVTHHTSHASWRNPQSARARTHMRAGLMQRGAQFTAKFTATALPTQQQHC